MSTTKKIVTCLKVAGLFTPLAPGIIASEVCKRAIDVALEDEKDSEGGKMVKTSMGLLAGGFDPDN